MPLMIRRGKELIRINPKDTRKLEYSISDGRNWSNRFSGGSNTGNFQELIDNGNEILGTTTKGLFYSRNDGRTWGLRKR